MGNIVPLVNQPVIVCLSCFYVGTFFVADIMCLDLQLHGGFWILKIVSVEYRELQM